jgi:chorismate lyase / 3-hydroxybenzoate synthase
VLRPVPALPDWYDGWCARVPSWARAFAGGDAIHGIDFEGLLVTVQRGQEHVLLAAAVPDIDRLNGPQLETRVADVYRSVLGLLRADGLHALRFWNFIPGILDPADAGLSRYMRFNAGRAAGYASVYARAELADAMATASGVGTEGTVLLVGCLASPVKGVPVENPRQVPAYRYSIRYGPSPPAFARATLTGRRLDHVLIGGTAAVRGEVSVEQGSVTGQLRETITNLEALVARAGARAGRPVAGSPLARLTSARVYVLDAAYASVARERLAAAGVACTIETAVATLCRPELLVEVEGTASLSPNGVDLEALPQE